MKDEIKEILDKLKDTADTSFFAVCNSQEELDKMPRSITKILSIPSKDAQILLDYITNLQEENERLKDIIKEAINYIDDNTYYKDHKGHINIDDVYIILQGEDKENLYKYTPEKGFRLVGDEYVKD